MHQQRIKKESDDEEEEEMRLVKQSADSIAALRAMEYRRGKALVKDKLAKTLAGTQYVTNACNECECECFGFSRLKLCV